METGSQLRNVLSKRHTVLESFLEGSKTKPELVDGLSHSRSTIDRAIAELLDVDCVEPTEVARNEFQITTTGDLALQSYQEYCADSTILQRNARLLNALPTNTVSKSFLSDAEIYSSPKTPDVALQPAIELLPEATALIGTAPVVLGEYFDVLIGWIEERQPGVELVLERDLLNSIGDNYESEFTALTDFESVEISAYDDQIPFALWIIEHGRGVRAGITIYDEGGIKGSLVADSDRAVKWAKVQYSQYKGCSSQLSL